MRTDLDLDTFRRQSKLFELLDEAGQKRLLDVAQEVELRDGGELMREDEHGDTFYVVLDGMVRVRVAAGGTPKDVATLGPGAFVGEIAALVGEPRSATVIASGLVRALLFDAAEVQSVLADYPRVREALVKLALKRSEDNLQKILLSAEGAPARALDSGEDDGLDED